MEELYWSAGDLVAGPRLFPVDIRGVFVDLTASSDALVISCSGIGPKGEIFYAMENSTRSMSTNKIFLCDTSVLSYQGGILGKL